MEITIKINGRVMSVEVSADVADYLEQAKRDSRKLYRERQRYWDGRSPLRISHPVRPQG